MEQGHLISFEGGSGREWGNERAERSFCHKDSLPFTPFPSYPQGSCTPFLPDIMGKGDGVAAGAGCPAPQPGNFCRKVRHKAQIKQIPAEILLCHSVRLAETQLRSENPGMIKLQ